MKPAATINCLHQCPQSDGSKPHVGGPIVQGSASVFIENQPAACQGHCLQCNSPSVPVIQSGSATIYIENKPAARLGDATNHGGVITSGASTVFIGG